MLSIAGGQEPEAPPVASAYDTTPDVVMGDDDEEAAVSGSNGKSEGTPKRRREATKEEEECAPVNDQARGDKAAFAKPHSTKEKGLTAGALKPSRYSPSTGRDSTPMNPSAKELPMEVVPEDSDEDGEEDRPGKDLREHGGR